MTLKDFCSCICRNRNFFLAYILPVVLCAVFLWKPKRAKDWDEKQPWLPSHGAYVMLLMASYWVTECIPLVMTSLFPVMLVPLLGIASSDAVVGKYLSDTILFLLGSVLMSCAFEYCNLNVRIALWTVSIAGAKIPAILLAVMFVTMILSMFCSNTSTTSMVLPIVSVIVDEFKKTMVHDDPNHPSYAEEYKAVENLKTLFFLATAFSASIGGTGIPTGSGTNIISLDTLTNFQQEVRADPGKYRDWKQCIEDTDFPFTSWFGFAVVPMILNILLTWLYLQIHFLKLPTWMKFWRKKTEDEIRTIQAEKDAAAEVKIEIKRRHKELGSINFHEGSIAILYIILIIMWICREPKLFPGWADTYFGRGYQKDATITLLICVLLYTFPKKLSYYKTFFSGGFHQGIRDVLMSWDYTEDHIPWGPFILLGGGSAMSVAAKNSGLNAAIGEFLGTNEFFKSLSKELILLFAMLITGVITCIASNTATAIILSPVLLTWALEKGINPLYLVIAPTISASYAYIFPVSTPPNAIAYEQGNFNANTMSKAGVPVTIISNVILYVCVNLFIAPLFGYNDYKGSCDIIGEGVGKSIGRLIQEKNIQLDIYPYSGEALHSEDILDLY